MIRDAVAIAGLLLGLLIAVYIMLADYANLRQTRSFSSVQTPDALDWPQPWGGHAWEWMTRFAMASERIDPGPVEAMLEARVRTYPIDPQPWLTLARIEARGGKAERTERFLQRAYATRPNDREALWASAQIALASRNEALAERQLKLWLSEFPADTGRALFIGSRWVDSADELIDRILPDDTLYLREAMRVALQQNNPALADAVWARIAPGQGIADPAFVDYIELLLREGRIDQAAALWAAQDPAFAGHWPANGDFGRDPATPQGFEWVLNGPASVRIQRDGDVRVTPPASLRIEFNGKENVALNAPRVRMPLTPGQHYRLSGQWRAEGLTTRSLPFLSLSAPGLRQSVPVPGSSFDWQPWQVEFQAGEEARLLQLDLRRARTEAFDRNIGGTLWLDAVRLEPIEPPRPQPTITTLLREAAGG